MNEATTSLVVCRGVDLSGDLLSTVVKDVEVESRLSKCKKALCMRRKVLSKFYIMSRHATLPLFLIRGGNLFVQGVSAAENFTF